MSVRARLDAEALEPLVESSDTDDDDEVDFPPLEAPLELPDLEVIEEEVVVGVEELALVVDKEFVIPKFDLLNPNESSVVTIDGVLRFPGTIG